MNNKPSSFIIDACDVFGNQVTCTYQRWYQHIISGHDEFTDRQSEVAQMIANPSVVYSSISHPDTRYIICNLNTKTGKKYCKIVVHYADGAGKIVTAYTAVSEGGDNIDQSRKLYPKSNV